MLSVAGASLATGSEGDTGADATESPEGGDCDSGIAITTEFGAVCSEVCESDATCPEAWGCKQVPQPGADPIGLCFPLRVSVTE